jgi:DNA-binding NarL/FixJ family response regulator
VQYALSKEESALRTVYAPQRPSANESMCQLTLREREVVALVGQGVTNRRIAEELFVSERTVETHVSRILKKLNLNSGAQVVAFLRVYSRPLY